MSPIIHSELPILNCDVCTLRPLKIKDVTIEYVHWLNDEKINEFLESRFEFKSIENVKFFLESQILSHSVLFYGIWVQDVHVGNVKLGPIDFNHSTADIGFFIGNIAYHGKGIATEAIKLLTNYAFNIGVKKITAGAYEDNIASIKTLIKSGFVEEGYKKSQVLYKENRSGVYIFGLTDGEN